LCCFRYGYPRNNLPHIPDISYLNWCTWPQNEGVCFFQGYPDTSAGDAQRRLNEDILWLFSALDVLTPSVYLGILPNETTSEANIEYINQTVTETIRLAALAATYASSSDEENPTTQAAPLVVPVAWSHTNNYWQFDSSQPRELLNLEDTRVEFLTPFEAGADGVLIWGAVEDDTAHDFYNTSQGMTAMQDWVDNILTVVLAESGLSCASEINPDESSDLSLSTEGPETMIDNSTQESDPTAHVDPSMLLDIGSSIQIAWRYMTIAFILSLFLN